MSQVGLGVMMRVLTGERNQAIVGAEGKEIKEASINEHSVVLRFVDDTSLTLSDHGQSCCESRYMSSDDDVKSMVGGKFIKAEVSDVAGKDEDEYGNVHDTQFLNIFTTNGVFTVVNHNEHNGYYGGFSIEAT